MYLGLIPIARRIRCALWVGGKNKDARFAQLRAQQSSIEAEIGQPLEWMPRPNRKTAAVYLEAMIDPKDETKREQVKAWFSVNAVAFYNAFKNPVQQLSGTMPADNAQSEDTPEDAIAADE